MKRNRKSLINAIAAVLMTLGNGLGALIFTKSVLLHFGSDFNGLNSTANQLVTILTLLEGGFTVATNVALFKPYYNREYHKVSAIASATKATFKKIGLLSLGVGVGISLGYSFIIQSGLARPLIFSVFFLTVLPVCFNFYYATKYRILLQAEQKEYVISFITLGTYLLGYLTNIVAMRLGSDMWTVRCITAFYAILNSLAIGHIVRKSFRHISFDAAPDFASIKGTKDILIQKITGVIYNVAPVFGITVTAGGTVLASVYTVYNNVFVLLKGVMHAVIDAPRLGIGELHAQGDENRLYQVFQQYEFLILMLLFVFITTASVMILPFVRLYTAGIRDTNYDVPMIAVFLSAISAFELLHIPSGHLINMSGNFRVSKQIQLIAIGIMATGFAVTYLLRFGIEGILWSVLITAVVLCILETAYVHLRIFSKKLLQFWVRACLFIGVGVAVVLLERRLLPGAGGYTVFFLSTAGVFGLNGLLALLLGIAVDRQCIRGLLKRAAAAVRRR